MYIFISGVHCKCLNKLLSKKKLEIRNTTVKPLYFEAHLIRIPVLFEFIVHSLMVLSSSIQSSLIRNPPNSNLLNWSPGIRIRGVLLY